MIKKNTKEMTDEHDAAAGYDDDRCDVSVLNVHVRSSWFVSMALQKVDRKG